MTGFVTSITYHPSGAVKSIALGNEITVFYTYNNRYWVKSIKAAPFIDLSYDLYDQVGNLLLLSDYVDTTRSKQMTYTNLDQLKTAESDIFGGKLTFGYDAVGNRTSMNSTTYSYNYNTNRLASYTGSSNLSYDANGNFTKGGAYVYDPADRLIATGNENYVYNGDGQRIEKASGTDVTIYHYDQEGNVIVETDAAGTVKAEYVYADGVHLAKAAGAMTYYHTDHLGSPLAMTDASKDVVWRRDYKPFGEEIDLGGSVTNTHKFTGKEFDAGTGLCYYGARYYDPVIGRFITVDPVKPTLGDPQRWKRNSDPAIGRFVSLDPRKPKADNPQDWNRYGYVLNNPLTFVDPFGLDDEDIGAQIARRLEWMTSAAGLQASDRPIDVEGLVHPINEVIDFLDVPYSTRCEGVFDFVQYYTDMSGIKTLPQTAYTAGIVLAAGETYAWAWPVVLNKILTDPQGSLDFTMSMFPGTTPTMNRAGAYGAAAGWILKTEKW